MLAPPPALADRGGWDDDDDHGGRHHRSHHDDDHHHHKGYARYQRHGDWCPPPRRYAYAPRAYYYYPSPPRRYYCEPCHHWYGTEVSFHYHVQHQHGIAAAVLPAVIIGTVFGAIFAGY